MCAPNILFHVLAPQRLARILYQNKGNKIRMLEKIHNPYNLEYGSLNPIFSQIGSLSIV